MHGTKVGTFFFSAAASVSSSLFSSPREVVGARFAAPGFCMGGNIMDSESMISESSADKEVSVPLSISVDKASSLCTVQSVDLLFT